MRSLVRAPSWFMLLLSITWNSRGVVSFSGYNKFLHSTSAASGQRINSQNSPVLRLDAVPSEQSSESAPTLPALFPAMATSLTRLGFSTPTPIQSASATRAIDDHDNNLLLIAPTGSGKTLAYLLPALSKAVTTEGTVLVVAPTRELAVQLQRDAVSLLANLNLGEEEETEDSLDAAVNAVLLAVRGVDFPTPQQLKGATLLIGTPSELLAVLKTTTGADFIAADTLRAVVLDEVDVLLPLAPKTFRTNLDNSKKDGRKTTNPAEKERRRQQEERQREAHKRKLKAAKRAGTQLTADSKNIVLPTELLLRLVAESRSSFVGGDATIAASRPPPQVLAGSATASRRTLDRLNRAMRASSAAANSDYDLIWSSDVTVCRPTINNDEQENNDAAENNKEGDSDAAAQHTIRAVTVPSQVKHRYISLSKESASSSNDVLSAVAKAANIMKPQSALVFLCGEFAKSTVKIKQETAMPVGRLSKTSSSRRDSKRKYEKAMVAAKAVSKTVSSEASLLSARKTCGILGKFGLEAQPLHVALGLEQNEKEEDDGDEEPAPFLVTFEGSARGLHFDAVDAVFIVGRPVSAASYLHLAGRVGRSSTSDADDGSVVIRPGTVVSICTKGSAKELDKWTRQIGGTCLEELVL